MVWVPQDLAVWIETFLVHFLFIIIVIIINIFDNFTLYNVL